MATSSDPIYRWQDIILIALAIVGAVVFFWKYPAVHPYSAADASLPKEQIRQKALNILGQLGYSATDFQAKESYRLRGQLIDSLQGRLGNREAVERLSNGAADSLTAYYWYVSLKRKTGSGGTREISAQSTEGDEGVRVERTDASWENLHVELDHKGRWVGFSNPDELIPQKLVHRNVLKTIFKPVDGDSTLFASHSDSLLTRLLYFDFQGGGTSIARGNRAEVVDQRLSRGQPYRYSRKEAVELARYYINQSHWSGIPLQADTVFIDRVGSVNVARVQFSQSGDLIADQATTLKIDVAPTGALLGMNVSVGNEARNNDRNGGSIWSIITSSLTILVALLLLVIFYRRLKARVIDTRSALVISIFAGLLMPLQYLLLIMGQMEMADLSTLEFLLIYITMIGSTGALGMLIFFVLSGVGESLTRHVWPGKLGTYDLIRGGMVLNRPVGYGLLRAMALGLILAGIWTVFLNISPDAALRLSASGNGNDLFMADKVVWAPLFVLSQWTFDSLIMVMIATLALGSLVYDWKGEKASLLVITATVALLPFFPERLFPIPAHIVSMGVIGVALAVIYIRWDFFTVWLSYFFFGLLLKLDTSWLPAGTMDWHVGLIIALIFAVALGVSAWSVAKGKTEKALPRYVPDYVEELAQEERMKQELEIAHRVQQSFLPVETPEFPGVDVAAICKPAFETGGDYYDMIRLDDDRIAVTIGDVSGKGIQAAFYMTFTKGILHSLCREVPSPAQLLSKANHLFYDNAPRGTFISLVYGILNLKDHTFRFARAGHNPVLYRSAQNGETKLLQPNGLGLGLTIKKPFEDNIREASLTLEKGDLLVLYTDGIVEAQNPDHKMYGVERLKKLMDQNRELSSSDILEKLSSDVEQFMDNYRQHDDMTVIVIRCTGDE